MAAIDISVPHQLGQAEARRRVEKFMENVQRDFAGYVSEVGGQWAGNQLNFHFGTGGVNITGTLKVEEDLVHVNVPLPMMAMLFKGKIEKSINEELKKLISRPASDTPS